MISLLKCPDISIDLISSYLENSRKEKKFSNFGYCESMLRNRFSKILDVPLKNLCLGSSATSLLRICCNLFAELKDCESSKYFFPAYSFFSTFSIASDYSTNAIFYDILDKSFLPNIKYKLNRNDFILLNIPFGSNIRINTFFEFARNIECPVIIDAAAALPGLIYKKSKLNNIPNNVVIIFSLHATKLLSCGEGGLCIFGNQVPNHIKLLTNFGINENRIQQWTNSTNAKMSEFNAAAGLASLDKLNENCTKIIKAKRIVSSVLNDKNIKLFDNELDPTLTMNIEININDKLLTELYSNGFDCRRWWSLKKGVKVEDYKYSYYFYNHFLGIPFDWENINNYIHKLCDVLSKNN